MGSVMITCPATGTAIRTGLAADPDDFARTPVFLSRTLCPLCRTEHEWFARDAWVEDGRKPARSEPRCEAA